MNPTQHIVCLYKLAVVVWITCSLAIIISLCFPSISNIYLSSLACTFLLLVVVFFFYWSIHLYHSRLLHGNRNVLPSFKWRLLLDIRSESGIDWVELEPLLANTHTQFMTDVTLPSTTHYKQFYRHGGSSTVVVLQI